MNDEEKQAMLDKMCDKGLNVDELTEEQLDGFLDALARMFSARIMNCVDASGRKDREWGTLSGVFRRVIRERKRREQ